MNNRILLCFYLLSISFLYSCKKEQLESKIELSTKGPKNRFETDLKIKKMLTTFYSSYLKEFVNENAKESARKLDSIEGKYCTKFLLDSIANEFENNELDYDPFIKAQDASLDMIETLSINKIEGSKNKFNVQYLEKYSGHKTNILVTVVKEKGSFKISSLK